MRTLLLLTALLTLVSCANSAGTSTGNPLVSLRFSNFSSSSFSSSSEKVDTLAITDLKMCFKRLRFKPVNGLDNNIDLNLGETTITNSGTLVTALPVPAGTYSRVEFDLNDHCASGKSIQLTKTPQSLSTNESVTIRFEGILQITTTRQIDLNIQPIISSLNTATSDTELKSKAEAANGSM